MIRVSFYIEESALNAIRLQSENKKIPFSQIIREGVDLWIKKKSSTITPSIFTEGVLLRLREHLKTAPEVKELDGITNIGESYRYFTTGFGHPFLVEYTDNHCFSYNLTQFEKTAVDKELSQSGSIGSAQHRQL